MEKIFSHLVPEISERIRCSDYLIGVFVGLETKSAVKKALKCSKIFINGKVASTGVWIEGGETIIYRQDNSEIITWDQKINIHYEDNYLSVVEKPAGIPTSGNQLKNLRNALPDNSMKSTEEDALPRPEPVHRLDSATSGLVIIAKTWSVRRLLEKKLQLQGIYKQYFALVHGVVPGRGWIDNPIEGKTAITEYKKVSGYESSNYGPVSLTLITLYTGRTHQIRIHLSELGYPILGDKMYNTRNSRLVRGLMLHAAYLSFYHPEKGLKVTVQSPIPKRMKKWLKKVIPLEG